jgi:hypothetical protein
LNLDRTPPEGGLGLTLGRRPVDNGPPLAPWPLHGVRATQLARSLAIGRANTTGDHRHGQAGSEEFGAAGETRRAN